MHGWHIANGCARYVKSSESSPFASVGPGVYVNFLGDEGADRVREAYPGPTWDRLVEVKRRYDPGNLFRRNQNIPPGPGPA